MTSVPLLLSACSSLSACHLPPQAHLLPLSGSTCLCLPLSRLFICHYISVHLLHSPGYAQCLILPGHLLCHSCYFGSPALVPILGCMWAFRQPWAGKGRLGGSRARGPHEDRGQEEPASDCSRTQSKAQPGSPTPRLGPSPGVAFPSHSPLPPRG